MAEPTPMDEVAFLTITKYGADQLGVDGNVGDTGLAVWMLEQALESAKSRHAAYLFQMQRQLIIPSHDLDPIDHHPAFPVEPLGDRPDEIARRASLR
jgi:hypothetical protein